MELLRRRVRIEPAPATRRAPPFEACFLGHAPGEVDAASLTAHARAELIERGLEPPAPGASTGGAPLRDLPLALCSSAEFDALFPRARSAASGYASRLAAAAAWLPRAVDDYFRAGGERLWVVVVPEPPRDVARNRFDEFVPSHASIELSRPSTWRGLAALLHLPAVGLVALPDLERLAIPADVVDLPEKRLPNPAPAFIPVGSREPSAGAERRNAEEMARGRAPAPLELGAAVPPLLDFLARWRPDVALLLALPVASHPGAPRPALDPEALAWLARERGAAADGESARRLARLAPLFPFLRSPRGPLHSPSGVVAGAIAARAAADGAWRSVAGRALPSDAIPWPPVAPAAVAALRDAGIGVLTHERAALQLDDERTPAPGALRSAEVVRFRGWMVRELERLGLELVFAPESVATPARLALEQWLQDLFRRGALAGRDAAAAFAVRELPRREGRIGFEIEVRPSVPIDRLVLSFQRLDGRWQAEAFDG